MSTEQAGPNILFILADQHNARVLGHRNHPHVRTPNLDRMAADGVRFDNAVAQNPICTPSRVSYHSGQYCHNHGYYGLGGPGPVGLPSVFGHVRKTGYRTAAIGKIHCPEYWIEDDCDMFHETCPNCSVGGRSSEYIAYLRERGVEHKEDLQRHMDCLAQGIPGGCAYGPSLIPYEHSQEAWIVRKAAGFMRECAKSKEAFFLHVSFNRPHGPYVSAREFWEMYDESELSMPPNADYEMINKAPHLKQAARAWRSRIWTRFSDEGYEQARANHLRAYLASVSQVDFAVGELLASLESQGLNGETVVVYGADHGAYVCEHGNLEKAPGICSDAVTRIPFIWRWPGRFRKGHVVRTVVEPVDLSTTLCSLAHLPAMETSDGVDLSPLLKGDDQPVKEVGLTEFAWSRSLRKGHFRYVYYPGEMFPDEYPNGFGELYNLESDPWEMTNLFFEEDYACKVTEMKNSLMDRIITTTRPATILPAVCHTGNQCVTRFENSVNPDGRIHPDTIRNARVRNYI